MLLMSVRRWIHQWRGGGLCAPAIERREFSIDAFRAILLTVVVRPHRAEFAPLTFLQQGIHFLSALGDKPQTCKN